MGTISRQSAVFFAGTIFTTGAGYVFKIYVARMLGAQALGIYALGITVVSLLGLVGAMGLPSAAPRFVATYVATGKLDLLKGFLARSGLALTFTGVLLGSAALLLKQQIAALYHTPAIVAYMPAFAAMLFTAIITTFLCQTLAGFKDVARRTVITNFIGTPVMMALTVIMVSAGAGLRGYLVAQVIGSVVSLLLLARAAWKLIPSAARPFSLRAPQLENEVIRFSAAVFGVGALEFLLGQTDKILLGLFLDARRVGIYAVAGSLIVFVTIILSTVNQIFSPTIADLHARGERELLARLFQTLTKWILGLTLPLAAVMVIFAPSLMRFFGAEFEVGWPVLVIGTVGQLVNCGVGSVGFMLLMSGNQGRLIKVQATMAVATVLLNLLLIPSFGLVGAAAVACTVNVISNVWYLREVRVVLRMTPFNRSYLGLIAPSCALVFLLAGVRYVTPGGLGPIGIVLVTASTYAVFCAIFASFGLDNDDLLIARALRLRVRELLGWSTEVPRDAIPA